jgi:hypothetical protein
MCESSKHGYYDADRDGYGVTASSVDVCGDTLPPDYAPLSGDCDDSNPGVHPGVAERCNATDDNCDGNIDEGAQRPTQPPWVLASKDGSTADYAWRSTPDSSTYDVVKGELASLISSGGNFTAATTQCLLGESAQVSVSDPQIPSGGHGYWYLVRPRNYCGAGTYDDAPPTQSGGRDAEIAAAAAACP